MQTVISLLKKNPDARNEKDLNQLVPFINQNAFFKERNIASKHLIEVCSELKYEFALQGDYVFH